MTPEAFVKKWSGVALTERSAAQQHFLDLCALAGHPTPAAADPSGDFFTFERGAGKTGGGDGFADIWKRGFFAIEYKGRHKDLDKAYQQILLYREALENPPLLAVCDLDRIVIHTNFTATAKKVYDIPLADLPEPRNLEILRHLFHDPARLRPGTTSRAITEAAAVRLGELARSLRARGFDSAAVARFVDRVVFCLFAEDVDLLPADLFTSLFLKTQSDPARLKKLLDRLFAAMAVGGDFGLESIRHFNGDLFSDSPAPEMLAHEIALVVEAAKLDWSAIDPSIFGTLFERGLDPAKRSQLGAHYTSREDIELLIEPVVMAPLRDEWAALKSTIENLLATGKKSGKAAPTKLDPHKLRKAIGEANMIKERFLARLGQVTVLDPACGSGNFLYVTLQKLKDLEKEVALHGGERGLATDFLPRVAPWQMHGIEISPYAFDLAQMALWIGYLQWTRHNGYGFADSPLLRKMTTFQNRDAILDRGIGDRGIGVPPMDPMNPTEPRDHGRDRHATDHGRDRHATDHGRDGHATDHPAVFLDPQEYVHVRHGANLPHWTQEGATYAVTFRLADSLPAAVLRQWNSERDSLIASAGSTGGGLSAAEQARLAQLHSERVEAFLDAGEGSCWMRDPRIADMVAAAMRHFDGERYALHAWCVMPNHVHAVFRPAPGYSLPSILHTWKSFTAHKANKILGQTGEFWQAESFDHLIRDELDFRNQCAYVLANPYKAGLAGWKWIGRGRGIGVPPMEPPMEPTELREHGRDGHATGHATEPPWPKVDFIVGNPPFLGGKMMRRELGDDYVNALLACYNARVPAESDLCCYWFEKARAHIEAGKCRRAGLLATQGIRGGANREVLKRIKASGKIFFAISDREWVLDGANVHISMVGFECTRGCGIGVPPMNVNDHGHDGHATHRRDADATGRSPAILDGNLVPEIHANLGSEFDAAGAKPLAANLGLSFMGVTPAGPFDLPFDQTRDWLAEPNPHGKPNSDVLRPYLNGKDLNQRPRGQWTIDFTGMTHAEASLYEAPFQSLHARVFKLRSENSRQTNKAWWEFERPRHELRKALAGLTRYIVTCRVAKHRIFSFVEPAYLPDSAVIAFARDDDYFFGVLHSRFHEVWSLAQGTQLREKESGFRYTPTTCFETFPFPEPTESQREAIAAAARELDTLRERWLNPPEWTREEVLEFPATPGGPWDRFPTTRTAETALARVPRRVPKDPAAAAQLKTRTLTNLYNHRPAWLANAHATLDAAVAEAYNLPPDLPEPALLAKLLERNLATT